MLSEEGMESCHRHQDYFCEIYKKGRKNLMTDMSKADETSDRAGMDAPEVPLLLPSLYGFFL